jgi:GNAT superfamily N-acetyltransferase
MRARDPGVEIRELEPGDERLLQEAMRAFRGADAAAPDLFLGDPRAHAFVAVSDERVVGWCHGYEVFHPEGRWMVVLMGIDVDPAHRRARVGRELLERFAGRAASKGHRRVWLIADAGADVARRLFPGTAVEPSGRLGHWWVFG